MWLWTCASIEKTFFLLRERIEKVNDKGFKNEEKNLKPSAQEESRLFIVCE